MSDSNSSPKKIAIMGSGAIGMEVLKNLHTQYPKTEIVVWNRDSGSGRAAAVGADQAESIIIKSKSNRSGEKIASIIFTKDMDRAMRGADIVVVTGGIPREDNKQERFDLAEKNIPFIDPIAKKAGELAKENPDHVTNWVIGTNPIGLVDNHFQEVSKIPHNKIFGFSGELDVSR